jgi:hypothetical protein
MAENHLNMAAELGSLNIVNAKAHTHPIRCNASLTTV